MRTFAASVPFCKHRSFINVSIISFCVGRPISNRLLVILLYPMRYSVSVLLALLSSDSPDKEDLQQLLSLLEMLVNDRIPAQKGMLSKFSAVMERNSWITGAISSTLLGWLMSQIH